MYAQEESVTRIGVYICHCGTNIAGAVDVKQLAAFAERLPSVTLVRDYKSMCSDPGRSLIQRDIAEHELNRVVVASCSPLLREATFRKAAADAGLNPFLVQMANIREQVAWVTRDPVAALEKAKSHVAAAVRRVGLHQPLQRKSVRILPRVLIVGGGIAGVEAALTLAEAGKEVILVEREPSIGGHVAMVDKTSPALDCAARAPASKMTAVKDNLKITLMSYSEVESVRGAVGNYTVRIRRTPREGQCEQGCVTACGERAAIDFHQQPWVEEVHVGAVIVATGCQPIGPSGTFHYGSSLDKQAKLAPVSAADDGVFLAGACQGPMDISDTVAQAVAAAAKALMLIDRGEIELETNTTTIDEEHCSGCRVCNDLCCYDAIEYDEQQKVSRVISGLCKGCGTCVAACPAQAITGPHFTNGQVFAEIEGMLWDAGETASPKTPRPQGEPVATWCSELR